MVERVFDTDGDDLSLAFADVTPEQARELYNGLLPFARPGGWVDALCGRLFSEAARAEPDDSDESRRNDYFGQFFTEGPNDIQF